MLRLMRLVSDLMEKGGKEHQDLLSDLCLGWSVKDGAIFHDREYVEGRRKWLSSLTC